MCPKFDAGDSNLCVRVCLFWAFGTPWCLCSERSHVSHHQFPVESAQAADFAHESVREQFGNEIVLLFVGEHTAGQPVIGTGPL